MRIGAALALAAVLGLLSYRFFGENDMSSTEARNHPAVAESAPFDSEIEAVEEAWGEPIPDDLLRIGGVDEWGWARARYRIEEDGRLAFEGAYRNWRVRYEGPFVLIGGKDELSTETIFADYAMSHIDGTDLMFVELTEDVPRDTFRLRPAEPERVERSDP